MPKIELEIKAQLDKDIHEALEAKLNTSGYNSKVEWLREQIRNFLAKLMVIANPCFSALLLSIKPSSAPIDHNSH